MQPHVFVVMPFGVKEAQSATAATDSEPAKPAINISFDEVYDLLIKPALSKAGCAAFRADKEPGAGDIRTDMYFELVTAEVILADISVLNPNVFYELGVRHGVAPRGVLMIHGGWTKRPFDVAPDRTFDYDGRLFVPKQEERNERWQKQVDAEVERLALVLRRALEVDEETIGSPVYKELVGLAPVDWTNIQTARAKYFGGVFAEWKARVEVAKQNGWPGDSQAANAPDNTYFQINSMLEQIYLFESLGFRPEAVGGVKKVLEQRRNILEKRIGGLKKSDPRFRKVVVFSGHMIDKPGRSEERFPPRKENAVRERIAKQLDVWTIGAGDLAICGGARGGDILFAELCADRGAEVWLLLPLPENQLMEESVRLPDSDWEPRFFTLRDQARVKVFMQSERLKSPPKGASVFSRNNLWMINTARVEANDPRNLYALLVWDGKPTGDGHLRFRATRQTARWSPGSPH